MKIQQTEINEVRKQCKPYLLKVEIELAKILSLRNKTGDEQVMNSLKDKAKTYIDLF
jgi:hypothetical protein